MHRYDAFYNHSPALLKGHRAHWALIVGYLIDEDNHVSSHNIHKLHFAFCHLYHVRFLLLLIRFLLVLRFRASRQNAKSRLVAVKRSQPIECQFDGVHQTKETRNRRIRIARRRSGRSVGFAAAVRCDRTAAVHVVDGNRSTSAAHCDPMTMMI